MAFCNQTLAGINLDCTNNKGGIKEVYIANYGDVASVTESEGKVSEITMAADAKFKRYNFRKNTGSMTSTLNVDETTGINFVRTELSLVFTKMETAKRIEVSALALGQLAVIVKDSNDILWYLGKDDYVSSSAGSGNTGTAKTDSNNYSITLAVEEDTYPFEVDATALASIVEE